MTDFHGNEAKKKIKKNFQNGRLKKLSFSIPSILNIFFQKVNGLVLGLVGLIDVKGIDVARTTLVRRVTSVCVFVHGIKPLCNVRVSEFRNSIVVSILLYYYEIR